jgi:hypothetical protein
MTKLGQITRKKLNKSIYLLTISKYFDGVPISEIGEILGKESYALIQEDDTLWEGFFCGEIGSAHINLAKIEEYEMLNPVTNSLLVIQWYKMDSGRYEINAYLS